ncbi:PPOX class F420-dependent oxidoreductase [Amycolatopsis suaedae]|uniref:PPOX class F420-dependent oxidoreductase n=1 Tax=Amycolatopsis suaedae TaxID=2510978 RepID=A0A4Q7JAY5_9PSEU|nr:PPOX class F420-dependent oxidoreductase [Amycolatopsis suaedae]RZQ64960.1 PPOX class F420-dependent oxidoreductase [Amycolatopsis suaedae]
MPFTEAERAYLGSQPLGRLATTGPGGAPQVRPVAFQFNDDGTIDIGGPDNAASQKYRNIKASPEVSFVVDDMTPDEPGALKPGWGRGIEIRGRAELVTVDPPPIAPDFFTPDVIRIHPRRAVSWHIEPSNPDLHARDL